MIINIKDPRVSQAVALVKNNHNITKIVSTEFEQIFESAYHCKIVVDPTDQFCTNGYLDISEEKYANWFVLQFGDSSE
jgi:hypothetical protein